MLFTVTIQEMEKLPVDEQWYSLGQALGVSAQELDRIQESEESLMSRKLEMFRVWIQNDTAPTWDKLDSALEEINEPELPSLSRQNSASTIYSENEGMFK